MVATKTAGDDPTYHEKKLNFVSTKLVEDGLTSCEKIWFWSPQSRLEEVRLLWRTAVSVMTKTTGKRPEISLKTPGYVTRNMAEDDPTSCEN